MHNDQPFPEQLALEKKITSLVELFDFFSSSEVFLFFF